MMRFWADLLTASRLILSAVILRLGFTAGAGALDTVTLCILLGWTTDTMDGHVARRDRSGRQTWLSRNDVTVDTIFVVSGLLYLALAGFVPWGLSLAYLSIGGLLLLLFRARSLVIALEAPLAILPAIVAFAKKPPLGWAFVGWAGVAFLFDRRRFFFRLRLFGSGWRQARRRSSSPAPPASLQAQTTQDSEGEP